MRKIVVKSLGVALLLFMLLLSNTIAFSNEEETSWKTLASMPTYQIDVQTEIIDGKIYAFGCLKSMFSRVTEVYDPSIDTWTILASKPAPGAQFDFNTEVVNGKVYAIGSWDIDHAETTEVYDPATDMWTTLASMPTARIGFQTEVVDGKIYAIGGLNKGFLDTIEVYDPATDTWTTLTSMSTPRAYFDTEVVDGKIYAVGGWNYGGNATLESDGRKSIEVYDPSTDNWTALGFMPTARSVFETEVVDGKIYFIGGSDDKLIEATRNDMNPHTELWNTGVTEVYDPSTDTWATLASMSRRTWFQTEVVEGKIYAIGGYGPDSESLSSTEVYNPSTDTWTTIAPMSTERSIFQTQVIDRTIYAIGGNSDNVTSMESYTVKTSTKN